MVIGSNLGSGDLTVNKTEQVFIRIEFIREIVLGWVDSDMKRKLIAWVELKSWKGYKSVV